MSTQADYDSLGGLVVPPSLQPKRQVYLLQRSQGKLGAGLNKTTGWVHKAMIKKAGVVQMSGVNYKSITKEGLWIEKDGKIQLLAVDSVVLCVGQESVNALMPKLGDAPKINYHIIGGAKNAAQLDAKRAIKEGWLLGMTL